MPLQKNVSSSAEATQQDELLTEAINAKYREVEEMARSTVEAGIKLGGMLVEKREGLHHGEWGPWLREHFEGSRSHAYNFIALYENRDKFLGGDVQRVGHLSLRGALKALTASDPFEEVFAYVEAEMNNLAAIDIATEPLSEAKDEDTNSLDYHRREAIRHHRRAEQGMKQAGEGGLKTLDSIRAMRDGGHDSDARGWLRGVLIQMSINNGYPGWLYGTRYRDAVTDTREKLFGLIPEDNPLAQSIAERWRWCNRMSGTVTLDLTEEEVTLARLLAPDALQEIDEAWAEDKDYELAIRKMETFVCPGDVPPCREGGVYRSSLTEEQLRTPFAELRSSGKLYETLER